MSINLSLNLSDNYDNNHYDHSKQAIRLRYYLLQDIVRDILNPKAMSEDPQQDIIDKIFKNMNLDLFKEIVIIADIYGISDLEVFYIFADHNEDNRKYMEKIGNFLFNKNLITNAEIFKEKIIIILLNYFKHNNPLLLASYLNLIGDSSSLIYKFTKNNLPQIAIEYDINISVVFLIFWNIILEENDSLNQDKIDLYVYINETIEFFFSEISDRSKEEKDVMLLDIKSDIVETFNKFMIEQSTKNNKK
jgi:hypothetical protein